MLGYSPEFAPSAEQQLILWLLSPSPKEELPPSFFDRINWTRFLEYAQQETRAYLHYIIQTRRLDRSFPADVLHVLRNAREAGAMQHLRRCVELRRILVALQSHAIPSLVLKGMVLADTVYPAPGLRFMTDIDLLVYPQQAAAARDAAFTLGYRYADRHLFAFSMEGETPTLHLPDTHQLLEIHTHLMPTSPDSEVPRLFDRAVPMQIAGTNVRTLHPEDFLLHLAIHSAERHQFEIGLLALLDITLSIAAWGDSLAGFPQLADRTGHLKSAQLVCALAAEMLNAHLPSDWAFRDYPEQRELNRIAVAQIWYGSHREVPKGLTTLLSRSSIASLVRAILVRMSLANMRSAVKRIYLSFRRGDLSRQSVVAGVNFAKRRERMRFLLNLK